MMSKETGEMRTLTELELQMLETSGRRDFPRIGKELQEKMDIEKLIMFEIGEEIEIKGHNFKLQHIDHKHHTLVLVSKELKRVY